MSAPEPEADGLRRYGTWAGCPQGRVEDTSRCVEEVWPNERGPIPHQCWRKRGHGPEGLYCKQHDPASVRSRDEARTARYEAQMERMREAREAPVRAAYLSGVRTGLEAARPVVARAYRDGLSDGCEDASTIANATPLDMEEYGSGYARRVVFPSAESIAKEAQHADE